MNNYKMGEKILVRNVENDSKFKERIFIKHGCNGVICVNFYSEKYYQEGSAFDTRHWAIHKPLPRKKYVPFAWADRELFRGKWVRSKNHAYGEKMVTEINMTEVYVEGMWRRYEHALEDVVFIDGTPFGKEVEDE